MPPKKVPARKRSEPIDIPRQAKAPSGVSDANEVSPKRAAKRSDIPKKAAAAQVRKPRARKPKADEELARKIGELIDSHFAK